MTAQTNDKIADGDGVTFNFENSFARELDGFFVPCEAAKAPEPQLLLFNQPLAEELCLKSSELNTSMGAEFSLVISLLKALRLWRKYTPVISSVIFLRN